MEPKLKKKSAEGYADGGILSLERLPMRQYIDADEDKSKELLAQCHEIAIDDADEEIVKHPATNEEIRQCCADIKVSYSFKKTDRCSEKNPTSECWPGDRNEFLGHPGTFAGLVAH